MSCQDTREDIREDIRGMTMRNSCTYLVTLVVCIHKKLVDHFQGTNGIKHIS